MRNKNLQYVLGIESSCDETAAAILSVNKAGEVEELSNVISSQINIHKKYGGVVPEIAAREHVLNILPVINEALKKAKLAGPDLSALAVTTGPGLITSLICGVETAKALAYTWKKPLLAINHIEGHIYANFLTVNKKDVKFPAVILTVSGGHTTLLTMTKGGSISIVGETRDDAAGEAYDKGAKMLGLGYPGGPIISKLAKKYKESPNFSPNEEKIKLPRPMIDSPDLDFSFSGLKTALLYELKKDKNWENRKEEYSYYYQQAIIDVLIRKTIKATKKYKAQTVMLTGGVSANTQLRKEMGEEIEKNFSNKVSFFSPQLKHTTDNAAMIAMAAVFKLAKKKNWPIKNVSANSGAEL